jgi:phosphate transport system substrate-binding protein
MPNTVSARLAPGRPRLLLALVAMVLCPCPRAAAQQEIRIQGSDTLIYVAQRFAAIYQRRSAATSVVVRGGGVAAAISALSSGRADVVQFEESNLQGRGLLSFPIAVQAIVVYVNQANPVEALTLGQLRSIFLGQITNWRQVGGPNLTIHLYAGESSTGTLAYFQNSLLGGREPYPFVGKANTKDLLEEIAAHPEAIGYGSQASAPRARALAIKAAPGSPAIEPTPNSIRSRRYPIARFVSWAVSPRSSYALKQLCTWVLSSEGQLVVESVGFEPLTPEDRASGLVKLSRSQLGEGPSN